MSDRSFQGDIAEILIYDTVLDTTTVKKIQKILGTKYGLPGFPSTIAQPGAIFNIRSNNPAVSLNTINRQTMKLSVTSTGNYSIKINDIRGKVVFRKNGAAPDAIVLKGTDFPNAFYYLNGFVNNSFIHQKLAVVR